jgi:uncharacterized protein
VASQPAPLTAEQAGGSTLRPWWFVVLTFGWTWAFWWSAVWSGRSWSDPLVFTLFALGGAGPLLSAAVLLRIAADRPEERDFWRRLRNVRLVSARGWAIVVVVALVPSVVGRVVSGADSPTLTPAAGLVLVTAVVAGLLEEPGWRGYLLDALSARSGVLAAAFLVGPVWALWHLPLFFLTGSYQHGVGLGSVDFWLFVLSLMCLSFLYAAVYVATGRSIAAMIVLHALGNAGGELISADGARATETVVILAMTVPAVLVLIRRTGRDRRG